MIYATIALALAVSAENCLDDPKGQCERFFVGGGIYSKKEHIAFNTHHSFLVQGYVAKPATLSYIEALRSMWSGTGYMAELKFGAYFKKYGQFPLSKEYRSEMSPCFDALDAFWLHVLTWNNSLDHTVVRDRSPAMRKKAADYVRDNEVKIMELALPIVESQIRLLNGRGINEAEQKKVVGHMVLWLQHAMRQKSISFKWLRDSVTPYPKGKSVKLIFPKNHLHAGKPLAWFKLVEAETHAAGAKKRAEATRQRKQAGEAALKRRTMERLQKEEEQRKRENAEQVRKDQLNATIGKDVERRFSTMRHQRLPDHEILNNFSKRQYSAADLDDEKKRAKVYKRVMMKYHPRRWLTKSLEQRVQASEIFKELSNLRDKNKKKQEHCNNPARR